MGLRNPPSGGKTFHVYVDTPEAQARIAELEGMLETLRNRPAEVKEVIKEVVKEDPSLLAKYNAAMKELGAIKRDLDQRRAIPVRAEASPQSAQAPAEPQAALAPVIHIKREVSKKAIAMAAAAGLLLGIAGTKAVSSGEPAPAVHAPILKGSK